MVKNTGRELACSRACGRVEYEHRIFGYSVAVRIASDPQTIDLLSVSLRFDGYADDGTKGLPPARDTREAATGEIAGARRTIR